MSNRAGTGIKHMRRVAARGWGVRVIYETAVKKLT